MSGYLNDNLAAQVAKEPDSGLVEKPFEMDELTAKIARLLAKGQQPNAPRS